jgi:hypothetical protein
MILGLIALIAEQSFRPLLRWWFFAIYVIAYVAGLVLNQMGWKEEKREQILGAAQQ